MTGVSENIMLGQFCPVGTGEFGIHLNEEMLKDAIDLDLFGNQQGAGAGTTSATPGREMVMTPGGGVGARSRAF